MKQQSTQVAPYKAGASKTPAGAPSQGSSASFGISDIAYIFYRHKKKIIVCSLLGIVAAAGIGLKYKTDYSSDSKLMIRYVVDSRRGNPTDSNDQIRNPDSRGDNIINSEVELITSLDLAVQVAGIVGGEAILKNLPGINTNGMSSDQIKLAAAVAIRNRLEIRVKPKSNVIGVSFQHPDATIARRVLQELIGEEKSLEGGAGERILGAYIKAHARVHRDLGLIDDLRKQKETAEAELKTAEKALQASKEAIQVVSVQDTKRAIAESLSKLRSQRNEAEQLLREAEASFRQITNSLAIAKAETPAPTPAPAAPIEKTNAVPAIAVPVIPTPTPEVLAEFQGMNLRLEVLRQREQIQLLQFQPTSSFVKRVSDQIAALNKERQQLIDANPGLTNTPAATTPNPFLDRQQASQPAANTVPAAAQPRSQIDLVAEAAKIQAYSARLQTVDAQLSKEEAFAARFAEAEPKILSQERAVQALEKQVSYLRSATEEATVTDALIASKASNISVLQYPTPAYPATGVLLKLLGGAVFGGVGLGLGLAILIEFVSDRSVRRPKQVVENLNVPLFLSVPQLDLPQGGAGASPAGGAPSAPAGDGSNDSEELARFAEALRDRLIMHFQIKEVTHKPKLIGVTSCGRGAGVTTLATSLAASLSETGEGNVLYVDVNSQMKASAAPFRKGKPVVGITEALGETGRDAAQVGENLYMVSLGDPASNKVGVIPKKLANLVPKIRESNYDYIIFDLPPVTQTSVAARVSGLLDTTVMVLESEKTQSELARQAVKLLGESNTELVAVLNKHKKYLPESLDTDL